MRMQPDQSRKDKSFVKMAEKATIPMPEPQDARPIPIGRQRLKYCVVATMAVTYTKEQPKPVKKKRKYFTCLL